MEIYKETLDPASQEFEKLLNTQLSKNHIEEGKIIEGKIDKLTDKFCFLSIPGLKSEPVLDIKELQSIGLGDKLKIGETLSVLLEKLEHPKSGEIVVSAAKAQKIKGWEQLIGFYERDEPINGKIINKVKGGFICEHIETGTLAFLPGSQVDISPVKDMSKLMNVPQKFKIIKLDKLRGNACVSRREIISSHKQDDKSKIIAKYKEGDIIENAIVKGVSSFGAFFFVNNEIDCLVHLQELAFSRINHPDEVVSVGEKHTLKVISVEPDKLRIGCSIKRLKTDPFEKIDEFELNKSYKFKVIKLMEFGAFCELLDLPGLSTLLHSSEIDWAKKNVSSKKFFKVGDVISCVITEIDKEKRRVAISHRLTKENPFQLFEKLYPVGTIVEGTIENKNEYSLFVKVKDLDVSCFLHANDLTYLNKGEEELAKYKIDQKIKVKVLEIKPAEQKIRVGFKQCLSDPFDYFLGKKKNQTITVKIQSSDNRGLVVRPENAEMDFVIKKSQIAINAADARPSRFTGGERIDCAIQDLNFDTRKVTLSIKLLEELQKAEALKKYGTTEGSGKALPFSTLADDLKKKKDNKK